MGKLVVKDNALMNASYNLDLVEQRLILLAILEARESGKGINANDPLTVHAESYLNQFNVARQTAYQALKDACNDLFARQFSYQEINERGNIENIRSRWVSEIRYIDAEATVKLIFAPAIIPLITRLEKRFTQYEMEQIGKLSTGYAIRLYEVLITWRTTGKTPIIELSDFRQKIGVIESEYQRMYDFKKYVLDPSINQVNKHTDIIATYQQHKRGRSIIGFSFQFKQKVLAEEKTVSSSHTNPAERFHKLTEKQLDLFSSKLSELAEIQAMAHLGEDMRPFAARIKTMLMDAEQQKILAPYLKRIGFNK